MRVVIANRQHAGDSNRSGARLRLPHLSWNHFFDTDKNALLGHSDNNAAQDVGRLKVTYHHNWFDGTVQRNPRVRFGEPVHVFNNYH